MVLMQVILKSIHLNMKIGILREGKQPPDKRVPFSPKQCKELMDKYPELEIVVQTSNIRCYKDNEYFEVGIPVTEDMADCDVLMGVKEVPKQDLIPDKTYFFFSHTIKKQFYNRKLLQEVVKKNIHLVDYEVLTGKDGLRIIGFGRFAGLVGAYNGWLTYGKRHQLFDLKPAHLCDDLVEMKQQARSVDLPPVKIVVTGGGRVANGAMELLDATGVQKVSVEDYLLTDDFSQPVYVQLNPGDYNQHKEGKLFDLHHFFQYPQKYKGNFSRFLPHTDLLVAAAFWDPKAPVLFTAEEMRGLDFKIDVIADVTCDIEGSIPSTKRASTIDNPFYDYNPDTGELEEAFSSKENITVMAIDNLPCELPKDASIDFGKNLSEKVIPHLLGDDPDDIIGRASITNKGKLTEKFNYLSDYLEGKE